MAYLFLVRCCERAEEVAAVGYSWYRLWGTWVVLSTDPYADARYLIEAVVPGLVVLLTFVFLFPLGFLALLEPGKRIVGLIIILLSLTPVSGWLHRTTHPQQLAPYHFDTMMHLTNRWSQPLAVAMRTSNFMKQFSIFAALALASGGSAPSR